MVKRRLGVSALVLGALALSFAAIIVLLGPWSDDAAVKRTAEGPVPAPIGDQIDGFILSARQEVESLESSYPSLYRLNDLLREGGELGQKSLIAGDTEAYGRLTGYEEELRATLSGMKQRVCDSLYGEAKFPEELKSYRLFTGFFGPAPGFQDMVCRALEFGAKVALVAEPGYEVGLSVETRYVRFKILFEASAERLVPRQLRFEESERLLLLGMGPDQKNFLALYNVLVLN